MKNVRKFPEVKVKKIAGGKDARRIVEEFVGRLGFNAAEHQQELRQDTQRWVLPLSTTDQIDELEIFLEDQKKSTDACVYIGMPVLPVPLMSTQEVLITALEIADGLVGVKLSLVGYSLVLSATLTAADLSVEELEYHYQLIAAQRLWLQEMLFESLGWERA